MIASVKSRALRRFLKTGDITGIKPDHVERLCLLVTALSLAGNLKNIAELQGYHPHKFADRLETVKINGCWRLTFNLEHGDRGAITNLDYVQYH